jgi:GntR family transcriptional regulator, transcriptional repressor for pyruvate dehydrogenase complex
MKDFESSHAAQLVVAHVRHLITQGELRTGDRLPAERDLATRLAVSRPSVRAGLRSLAAMGVIQTRRGAGSFIAAGPPALGADALRFLAALHGFTRAQMFEARLILEVAAARLAAERATPAQLVVVGDELTEMFAALDDPQAFLLHDIGFHRALAAACGNPILSAIVDMVSELFREQRRHAIGHARDLKDAVTEHRAIYQAVRARDAKGVSQAMTQHLERAELTQAIEEGGGALGDQSVAGAPIAPSKS